LNLEVSAALLILDITKVVFIVGVCVYLFQVSKIKKDATKLKEWEVLSFTALLVSILSISNITWAYYTNFLVLSFVLIIFVIPLTRSEKAVLWLALALFTTRIAVQRVCWWIGSTPKTVAYIIATPTIGYILFTILVFYVIRDRAQRGHWKTPV
jgi:apolipoprotein N-acyltransferase